APVKPVPVSVTLVPVGPLLGANEEISGAEFTRKLVALVPVPAAFVTVIFPLVAPVGTVALICVSEFTVNVVAAVPLKLTPVAPVKPVPVSVTLAPVGPLVGANEEISGAEFTRKLVALVPVPAAFVTVIFPVVAPVGTVALICVSEFTVNVVAAVPLKLTPVAPVKPVPVRVTLVPAGPLTGVNEVMLGTTVTVKLVALVPVPAAFVTVIFPLVAPVGTVALICASEFTVNVVAAVPLKLTPVAPVNPVPVSVTLVATGPLGGVNDVMLGGVRKLMPVALAPLTVTVRLAGLNVKLVLVGVTK